MVPRGCTWESPHESARTVSLLLLVPGQYKLTWKPTQVGVHLSIHNLPGGAASIDEELVIARRDTFFA